MPEFMDTIIKLLKGIKEGLVVKIKLETPKC